MFSELVSAIMPTRGRAKWAREALAMFEAQTYPLKELVVVDDLQEPSFLTPPVGVQYHRVPRLTIGGKRNLAISRSAGEIIIHWDSDDIYSPDRIAHQVSMLLANDVDLVGYNSMEFVDVEKGHRYQFSNSPGYAIGVSFCYWRKTWELRRFDPVDTGEDEAFRLGRRVLSCDSDGRIIARIHNANTSDKRKWIPLAPMQWRQLPAV